MIKHFVQEIGGVGLYGMISLCLFFTVFTGAFVWALLHKRSFCNAMSALPLQDETSTQGEISHE